jgi:hypothetical protein
MERFGGHVFTFSRFRRALFFIWHTQQSLGAKAKTFKSSVFLFGCTLGGNNDSTKSSAFFLCRIPVVYRSRALKAANWKHSPWWAVCSQSKSSFLAYTWTARAGASRGVGKRRR